MNNTFSKKELSRLGCTEEETKLIMKYQKLLPMPDNDFEMSARILHSHLQIGKAYGAWILSRIKKYNFKENVDFKISYEIPETLENTSVSQFGNAQISELSPQKRSSLGIKTEYYLSINMCKELCTIENNDLGRLARQYFILMEKVLKENKEWLAIRDPEKLEYKNMSAEIDAWMFRIWHRKASRSDYAVEANGINKIVTGKTSQELKIMYNCPTNELIRDYLKKDHNEELLFLERQNQVLLRMDMGYTERMNLLSKMHEVTFKTRVNERIA